jgi:hypothetical protein
MQTNKYQGHLIRHRFYLKVTLFFLNILLLSSCQINENPYETLTACEKEQVVWDKIVASEYNELPPYPDNALSPIILRVFLDPFRVFGLIANYLRVTLNRESDEINNLKNPFEQKRSKVFHSVGSVAKIDFISDKDSPFTGLFKKNIPCGLMRLSLAVKPSDESMILGGAVKFFVDEKPSANFMVLSSLDEQKSYNSFQRELSNIIPKPTGGLFLFGMELFETVTNHPLMVDVSFLAEDNEDKDNIVAPWQLFLTPNPALKFNTKPHEVREDWESIQPNTLLYSVYGIKKNQVKSERVYLGYIISKSRFISSEYGDKTLFFRHNNADER